MRLNPLQHGIGELRCILQDSSLGVGGFSGRYIVGRIALHTHLPIRKREIEIANVELIAFVDALRIDAIALVFDAIRRIEVFDIVGTVFKYNGAMLSRNIGIADDEIGELRRTPDDVFVFVDCIALPSEDDIERLLGLGRLLRRIVGGLRLLIRRRLIAL